jgi:hypothetical protein
MRHPGAKNVAHNWCGGNSPQHGTALGELQGTGINIDPGLPPLGSVRDVFLQNKEWQPDIDRVSVEDAREGLRDDEGDPAPFSVRILIG